jgi:Rieske Fe-S protein
MDEFGPETLARAQATLSRRSFVRTFALFSAASWLGGTELKSILVAELSAQSSTLPGIFRLNLNNFPALQAEVGSVRLSVTGMPTSFRQIIVSRLEGSQFYAVTSQCSHQGNPVSAMNLTTRRLVCPTHGSQFAPDGARLVGPAINPLTRYTATFDGANTLSIEIPGLGFLATVTSVVNPSNAQKRLQLEFPTVNTIRYGVQFRSSLLTGSWAAVPFATTVDGAISQTTLTGNNAKATVFVEPPAGNGFYAISRGV